MRTRLIGFVALLAATSCSFSSDWQAPEWEIEFFGPLVKMRADPDNLATLLDLDYEIRIEADELGLSGGSAVVPPITVPEVGPFPLEDFTDVFAAIDVDTAYLDVTVDNGFPFALSAGAILRLLDSRGVVLAEHVTESALAAGGTLSFTEAILDKRAEGELVLRVLNVGTPGTTSAVSLNGASIRLRVRLRNVDVTALEFVPQNRFVLVDTSEFNLEGTQIETETLEGSLYIRTTVEIPAGFAMQLYFLDDSRTVVLDSLYADGPAMVPAAAVATDGTLIEASVRDDTFALEPNRLAIWRQAEYVAFTGTGDADFNGQPTMRVPEENGISIRVIGDLKKKILTD